MKIKRVVPDIKSDRIEESRDFYAGFLGFQIGMDMGWVITFVSRSNPTAQVTVMRRDESATVQPQMSIEVDDVDRAHAVAIERNLNIVYPLSDEPWGVRRFFVADPNGVVINILSHTTARKRSNERLRPTKSRRKTTRMHSPRKRLRG
jgi:catechol 2,3-dioxygenase-like lactoylglutathione lyase family enzyme